MKKLKICLLVLILAAVAAVGIKYMNHSGKSNNEGDKNRYFDVTAIKQTEASTAEEQLLAASSIEKLNLSDYVDVADYEKIITITDREAKTLNNEKENYSARRKLTDKILDAIVEDSEFTNIDSLVEEETARLKVVQINKAADEGKSLDEYIEENYSGEEAFYSELEEQAEKNVKYELVTYALCKELQIAPGDKEIIEDAERLAEYEGVETVEDLIGMYGADYVRYLLLAYGDNGLREPLISANMKVSPANTPKPTKDPRPSTSPTTKPTSTPHHTATPTTEPTSEPTVAPTAKPTATPTSEPVVEPTSEPVVEPTSEPTPPDYEPEPVDAETE